MEQKDRELLLKDLCARLPYGVVVRHADYLVDSDGNYTGQFWYKRGYLCNICKLDNMTTTIIESEGSDEEGYEHICDLERSLPYLRPMSSMTEEEKEEYHELCDNYYDIYFDSVRSINWLNKKMFDYCTDDEGKTMIEKDLALEAPKDMYK